MRSLQMRLSALTLASVALVVLPFFAFSYVRTVEEVGELCDARLAQNARTIDALVARGGFGEPVSQAQATPAIVPAVHRLETEVGFQYWTDAAHLRFATDDVRDLAFDAAPSGFTDLRIDGKRWRIFTLAMPARGVVRTAERYDSRRDIARALLLQNVAPLLIGLPLLALLVAWAVRRGLAPLARIAGRLDERAPDATDAVDTHDAPREVEPLMAALNGLLQRMRGMFDNERQFTANAAHELRTPLAGALVHIDNARAAADPATRDEALGEARRGIERMSRVVNQMLDLARWDAAAAMRDFAPVDLGRCIDEEFAALGLATLDKDIEIVRRIDDDARIIEGWEPGLRTVLRNLLDNAIRYGFRHGRVDVEVARREGRCLLTIEDRGPGIAPSQRIAMLERFRRGAQSPAEGSGLGLSIVARIVHLHGAQLVFADAPSGQGLRVEILFPAASTQRTSGAAEAPLRLS